MGNVYVKMLDIPEVFVDGRAVVFPFRKVEALFYYLVVKGQASREELTGLLWGNLEETLARKNLRNALYQLKKIFNMPLLFSSCKALIFINTEIEIKRDIDCLKDDELFNIEDMEGEFLKGFSLKAEEGFDEWILRQREYYKALYLRKMHIKLKEALEKGNNELAEKCALKLIKTDEFDEKACRALMKLYTDAGAFSRAIEVYKELVQILDRELGIAPEVETKELFNKIISLRANAEPEAREGRDSFFYGRQQEIEILIENFKKFSAGSGAVSALITGEAGIGKSRLVEEFLKGINIEKIYVFKTSCYQAEEGFFLRPWNSIFAEIKNIITKENIKLPYKWRNLIAYFFPAFSDFDDVNSISINRRAEEIKYQAVEQVMAEIFQLLGKTKKIILIFDDIQWMDNMSLSLLNNLMLHQKNITFIGMSRKGYDRKIEKFIYSLKRYNSLRTIELRRFTRQESIEFIEGALTNYNLSEEFKNRIYDETSGNTFFLVECINTIKENGNIETMTPAVLDIIKSRFMDISEDGKKLLNIASIFFDEVPLYILRELSGKDELDMIDTIEELQEKLIFQEVPGSKITFRFTHQKLRDYIYNSQSQVKIKILHEKIGKILEGELKDDRRDIILYPRLIYHFSNSGNRLLELKYSIKNLKSFLDESHELFPIINAELSEKRYLQHGSEKTMETLIKLGKIIEEIKEEEGSSAELRAFEIEVLHMVGRYLIREGEYERGTAYIKKMIDSSLKAEDYNNVLRGCRQMIYYSIQVHDVKVMQEYVENSMYIAEKYNLIEERGILLRLQGLNKIMLGEYQGAEKLLKESIDVLDKHNASEDLYVLNIAAAYNYMGDAKKYVEDFEGALHYYNKAIKICENRGITTGLTVFYTNAGQILFNTGKYEKAREFLTKALEIYDSLELLWGRAIAESFMALLDAGEGYFEKALKTLERAEKYSLKIMNPYEISIVSMAKVKIEQQLQSF